MRSFITFTNSKSPLSHMVLCLSPQGRITGDIHGIHKPEMFQYVNSGSPSGQRALDARGTPRPGILFPTNRQAEGHWDTKDNPVDGQPSPLQLSVEYIPAWMIPKHFQHWDGGLRAQVSGLSSPAASLCSTAVSAGRV